MLRCKWLEFMSSGILPLSCKGRLFLTPHKILIPGKLQMNCFLASPKNGAKCIFLTKKRQKKKPTVGFLPFSKGCKVEPMMVNKMISGNGKSSPVAAVVRRRTSRCLQNPPPYGGGYEKSLVGWPAGHSRQLALIRGSVRNSLISTIVSDISNVHRSRFRSG